jgi:hypothetical protein
LLFSPIRLFRAVSIDSEVDAQIVNRKMGGVAVAAAAAVGSLKRMSGFLRLYPQKTAVEVEDAR